MMVDGTAVIVDDGAATGSITRAACRVARSQGPARIVLAVAVAAPDAVDVLADVADEVLCLLKPTRFGAVGRFYDDSEPTTDAQVVKLLHLAARRSTGTHHRVR